MANQQPDTYLSVLKASYDYEPQSEDEIAIKENELLFLLERVDQDWWKVKIKPASQEADSLTGLVPAAYVEQAEHTSLVKVLYDYEAASSGELTVKEDDVLLVFETDQDWLLVQSRDQDKAGYVPGNYVEAMDDPSRPLSTYIDPEERVASTKVTADDIRTWSVAEIDKKGKKKKGTLGVGNGAVFFASEADKNPVQKWQTSDITDISSEKAKHIRIEIAGPSPTILQFHVGSKENTDEILGKLNSSRSLSSESSAAVLTASPTVRSIPPTLSSSPKKASVHFSPASPVIIPPREESEDSEDGEEKEDPGNSESESAVALYDFSAVGEDELSVVEGEKLIVLEKDGDEWWKCQNINGSEGVVPASYLELAVLSSSSQNSSRPSPLPDEDDRAARDTEKEAERLRIEEQHRKEELELAEKSRKKAETDRRAKDAAAAAEAERNRRKAAAKRTSSPPASLPPTSPSKSSSSRLSVENSRPSPDKTRIWHDRSGQFRVEAAFLGFSNGKVRLHKVNGVVVEVPSEKMSVEDMRYIEKAMNKKRSSAAPTRRVSDDDVPLAIVHPGASISSPKANIPPVKKTPKIDWFDFFLSAGCDLDDCTRYAASFERDKIDETILLDITESTMRSLGLREGDIIRVRKAIEKRKPNDNLQKPSLRAEEQIRRDKELAEKLQAQEIGGTVTTSHSKTTAPPNLFAGPGGVLKNPRRGRPQPTIATASDQIQRTSSPQTTSPAIPRPPSASAAPMSNSTSGSVKPVASTPRTPSAPPVTTGTSNTPSLPLETPATDLVTSQSTPTSTSLAKTTESDVFDQLARLSELRKASTPLSTQRASTASPTVITPPARGMGIGSSPIPMGQINTLPTGIVPQPSPQPIQQSYNGPRGPFAPVPANQGLLQPLIPTQTGFNSFVPTRSNNAVSPFQSQLSVAPSFLTSQPTGPTGLGIGTFNSFQHPGNNFSQVQSHTTGFNPAMNQSPFGAGSFSATSGPPLPSTNLSSANPANVFAQMKSGTFAIESDASTSQPSDKYDALRPNTLAPQMTGWNQPYNYAGYQH
ncbi:hypothetical protein BDQ17DRAFT_1388768 [Cyathus striatus]|nr:hypothetical protein BDQ17DRAFT_1388768 [Cyathus striatus]